DLSMWIRYCAFRCCSFFFFFFSSRRRHTRSLRDWSSDVCSSDLVSAHRLSQRDRDVGCRDGRDLVQVHLHPILTGYGGDHRFGRSEERRVGKECRSRWGPCQLKKKEEVMQRVGNVAAMKGECKHR